MSENDAITCLLKAAFHSLKVQNAYDVLEMFIKSERIYQDMLLALDVDARFNENFIIREFQNIDVDMEFRGFVFDCKLNALSQYNYLIYSERLNLKKEDIEKQIIHFYNINVKPKIEISQLSSFIIDFAILKGILQ